MNAVKNRRPVPGDALVALVILAVAVWGLLALPKPHGNDLTVLVTVGGDVVWTCPLEELAQPVRYAVDGAYPLTLEVSGEGVRVVETSCPGEDCRHTGQITGTGQQIVCLPNRTVITLQGDAPSYDAVTG